MVDTIIRWLGLPAYASLATAAKALIFLVIAVIVLFAATVIFAIFVLALRTGHMRSQHRREERVARWHDTILEVLEGAPPEKLHDRVRPGEEIALLAVLLQFSRR